MGELCIITLNLLAIWETGRRPEEEKGARNMNVEGNGRDEGD